MKLTEMQLSDEEIENILLILKAFKAQWMRLIDKNNSEFPCN